VRARVEFKCLVCGRAWSKECDVEHDIVTGAYIVQELHRWECAGAEFSNTAVIQLGTMQEIDVTLEFKRDA
jgi:hypothetical protein